MESLFREVALVAIPTIWGPTIKVGAVILWRKLHLRVFNRISLRLDSQIEFNR